MAVFVGRRAPGTSASRSPGWGLAPQVGAQAPPRREAGGPADRARRACREGSVGNLALGLGAAASPPKEAASAGAGWEGGGGAGTSHPCGGSCLWLGCGADPRFVEPREAPRSSSLPAKREPSQGGCDSAPPPP